MRGPPAAPSAGAVVDQFIGRRVELYWPEEGGWCPAVVTDYNPATGEHCVTYNMNTEKESFEWQNLRKLNQNEFKWVAGPALSLAEMFPPGLAPRAGGQQRRPLAPMGGTPKAASVVPEIDRQIKNANDPTKLATVKAEIDDEAARIRAQMAALEDSEDEEEGAAAGAAAGGAAGGAGLGDHVNATDGDSE